MELGSKEQLIEKYCVDKCNALGLMCIKLTCQVGVLDRLILGRPGCGICVRLNRDGSAYISKAQEVC